MQPSHFHLFLNSISPESISICLVDGNCLFDHLRPLEPKLMGSFKVSSTAPFHHGDNSVSFLQNMMNQPVKCWFMLNALSYGIWTTWIGCNSLKLDNFFHDVDPSFHLQQISQPAVDFLRDLLLLTTIFWSSTLRC